MREEPGVVDDRQDGDRSAWKTLLLFGLVGGIGTLAQYVVLIALVQGAGLGAVTASSVGALAGALVNFVLNHRFTFRQRRDWRSSGPRYLVTVCIGLALNAAAMALLVHGLAWHYFLSQVVATGLAFVVNFLVSNYWAFRKHAA